jgi:acetyl-CoA carboxylase biotin carboxylase subunit
MTFKPTSSTVSRLTKKRVLIANRGEIVLRVARTCNRLGYSPCGIYSEADKDSLHIKSCQEAISIGGFTPTESYLRVDKVIDAATKLGCEMIHPGYGFLAENSSFAASCERSGFTFIGPSSSTLELSGDKARAREVASSIAPVLPGKEVSNESEALGFAEKIGFPIIVKAVKGGGGRGLRTVYSAEELKQAFASSRDEALISFGSGRVYIEKYLENPRHIEVQILGDSKTGENGGAINLGERECSVQRRHQKLIEETPSAALTPDNRAKLLETATAIAAKMKYDNAGTVEFLFKGGAFYFMELNSRIQVEHPITEMVTGVDIVEQQLRIASGDGIAFKQGDVSFHGHAIECRLNAEHPMTFAPFPGVVEKFVPPLSGTASGDKSVRIDTALYSGYSIPPYYDSLIAKLICHAADRGQAIQTMREALISTRITGVPTTIPFHLSALNDSRFLQGNYDTSFVSDLKPYSVKSGEKAAALFAVLPRRLRKGSAESAAAGTRPMHTADAWHGAALFEAVTARSDSFGQKWRSDT